MTTKSSRTANKKAPPATDQTCEFCKKSFVRESAFLSHVCERKRRWLWKDEKYVRLGFHAYQKFYTLSMRSKKVRTYEDFMDSRFYTSFTKFGKHLLHINAIDAEGFTEFLIKTEVKIEDWTADWAYETWARELLKKESPDRALTRSIELMEQWSKEMEEPWIDFFRKVSPVRAVRLIQTGRLSPWILYAGPGNQLFDRMSDEQMALIKEYINPIYWQMKIRDRKEDMDFIKKVLKEAGV